MRTIVAILVVAGWAVPPAVAQGAGTAAKAAPGACALLPQDVVAKVSSSDPQMLRVLKPSEEKVGASGSACHFADVTLQVDPFTTARLEDLRTRMGKDWVAAPGIGDAAYFRDNRGEYAELYVRTGTHVFTIQMTVPAGKAATDVKPNLLTLAQAIAPKLQPR
jgi:hypothetical protein